VDLSGWVGVGLGGNCDCRCGTLYAPMLGGFAGLVSLTSSPYSSELLVLGGGLVCLQGFAMCVCLGLAHLVLWKWFSIILPHFLVCLEVLVPGVCVCVVFSPLCCTLKLVSYY